MCLILEARKGVRASWAWSSILEGKCFKKGYDVVGYDMEVPSTSKGKELYMESMWKYHCYKFQHVEKKNKTFTYMSSLYEI